MHLLLQCSELTIYMKRWLAVNGLKIKICFKLQNISERQKNKRGNKISRRTKKKNKHLTFNGRLLLIIVLKL